MDPQHDPNRQRHIPLDETLSRAAAQLAGEGRRQKRPEPQRPAPPPVTGPVTPEAPPASSAPGPAGKEALSSPSSANPSRKEAPSSPSPAAPAQKATAAPPADHRIARATNQSAEPPLPHYGTYLAIALLLTTIGIGGLSWALFGRTHATPVTPVATTAPALPAAPLPKVVAPRDAPAARVQPRTPAPAEDGLAVVVKEPGRRGTREIIHTVQPGENLWSIAGRYINDPWAYRELAARSGIADPNRIRPGDQVRILIVGEEKAP